MRPRPAVAAGLMAALACAFFATTAVAQAAPPAPQAPVKPQGITFTDVTRELGITWKHTNGATADRYLIETMGGGAAFLDYNRDGRLDIFLVQSGCHKLSTNCTPASNALYRQNSDGSFTDVTAHAGVAGSGYGQGVAVGDYDNDGDPDLYVTAFGRNTLFRNNGDGSFTDVTNQAGVGAGGWSTSAAFFDYNHDGLADLFVGRYLEWNYENNPFCGERRPGMRSYCHPDQFRAVPNRLYRNQGNGTFVDVTEAAGLTEPGKALGVVAFDFNQDGWLDLYVANDAVRNFLFRNNGNGTFTEIALLAEVAYGASGKPASGMGVDAADYNGDGRSDLFVTNIDFETNYLFQNAGEEIFNDVTATSNLAAMAVLFSGFGTRFLDYDNDGDPDLLIVENGGAATLLRNDSGNRNPWIGFELAGRGPGRDLTGALVVVTSAGRKQVRELVGGASYCSAHDPRLLFGLGASEKAEKVEVHWPGGGVTVLENLPARRYHRIQEPAASAPAGKP